MSGGFGRSGVFGIVGVLVTMALVAVIGLTLGSGEDVEPKLVLGLVFGVVAVFMVLLFALQRSDLNRASGTDRRFAERALAEGGRETDDPTALSEAELWAALAVRPIDREAVEARAAMWGAGRRSLNLGIVITALIFLTVPPIYMLESFVPLMIGGPLIALAAIYGSVRAVAPGGEMDRGYENVGRAMAPLGLEVTERPTVSIETRDPVGGRVGPRIRGAVVLGGERHGRAVSVRLGDGGSEVTLGEPCRRFEAKSRRVRVESGPEGLVVARKGGDPSAWLCDLWLAERLAT